VPKQHIDELIQAGWRVLETDFNETAFEQWREKAQDCLVAVTGDDSSYMDYLKRIRNGPERLSLLTGVGVLSAVMLGHFPRDDSADSMINGQCVPATLRA
jgi:hypothetical protein